LGGNSQRGTHLLSLGRKRRLRFGKERKKLLVSCRHHREDAICFKNTELVSRQAIRTSPRGRGENIMVLTFGRKGMPMHILRRGSEASSRRKKKGISNKLAGRKEGRIQPSSSKVHFIGTQSTTTT